MAHSGGIISGVSTENFNNDWKFLLGDLKNAQKIEFNDRTWNCVDLPHDWVISRPFNRGKPDGYTVQNMQGFFAWEGVCWYRKEFILSQINGRDVYIYFGGAYRNSSVFINGKLAGGRASGYSSFEIEITDLVKEGKNIIAVRLDNGCEEPDRWYSGSGLFRNVFLKILPVTHIKTCGVHVESKFSDKKNAEITVKTSIVSKNKTANGSVILQIFSQDGSSVGENSISFDMSGKNEIIVEQKLSIQNPQLWSADKPSLYSASVSLQTGAEKGPPVRISFGIRNIEIAYNRGMTVNGEKVKLKGVCLHHDSGITGSAYYDAVWRRRLLILKSIGCNAIRTSHNPPS